MYNVYYNSLADIVVQITVLIILFILSYLGVGLFRNYALKHHLLDHPNQRSSHVAPTPRGGGIVIASLWLLFVAVSTFFYQITLNDALFLFLPALLITVVGFLDDRYDVPILIRILVHFAAAVWIVILLVSTLSITLLSYKELLFAVIAIFIIVWSINSFNFMDGLDGFSSIEAIFYFAIGGYLIYASSPGAQYFAFMAWVLVAILLGFFLWNKPSAKIFMGDAGSSFLGFLVAAFGCYAIVKLQLSAWLWIYLYGAFAFDATITLMRRMLRGEKWYQGHRLHAYQRLHQSGFSHLQVLFSLISLNIIISLLVLWAYYIPSMSWLVGLTELILLTGAYLLVEYRYPM